MKQFDRTRPDFSPYGFTGELWAPARMPRPDRHNEIEVNLLKSIAEANGVHPNDAMNCFARRLARR